MRRVLPLAFLLLPGFAVLPTSALAQTARSGSGAGANAQAMQQLQQLASERTTLQSDIAKLKKQFEEVQKERDALKSREQALGQRVRSSDAAAASRVAATRESSEKELNDLKGRSQELVAKFRETAQTLNNVEVDRAALQQTLLTRNGELNACVDRNAALFTLNGELLGRMEGASGWSRLARLEPFTQLKRIELENLADDYRTRGADQRVGPGANPPAPAPAPALTPAPAAPALSTSVAPSSEPR